jgi:glycosyltransferase involved in cell wall biosynthesis
MWIEISDISIRVPPASKGAINIDDGIASKSTELKSLIASGIIEVVGKSVGGIHCAAVSGNRFHVVPSTDVWSKSGVKYKYDDEESKSPVKSPVTSVDQAKTIRKGGDKRFVIGRAVDTSITIEGLGLTLGKQREVAVLSAQDYFSEVVQKSLHNKQIRLVRVEQCFDGEWVEMDKALADPSSILASPGQPCVFWEGPIFDGGGYANMNRQYVFNLDRLGVCVKPSLISTLMDVEEGVKDKLMALSRNMIPLQSPKVYATNVPGKHCGRVIAYTMMETENKIHPTLVHRLIGADEIWVPCEWNRQVFAASGVKSSMRVMPLGVDSETYAPRDRSVLFAGGTKGFVFLSVFNWNWRKGPDVMIKAYSRAFTSRDDVSMVMVSRFVGQKSMSAKIFEDINNYVRGEKNKDKPHLVLVDDVIPTFMMPLIYNSASACLQISRGEGFGLPACEAIASGVPLLASDHGGHRMFLNADIATLVRPDRVKLVDKSIEWISPFYHGMEFVDYSDRAIDEIAQKMRWMYENREKTAEMAIYARRKIVDEFNWERCAENVKSRLMEIQP